MEINSTRRRRVIRAGIYSAALAASMCVITSALPFIHPRSSALMRVWVVLTGATSGLQKLVVSCETGLGLSGYRYPWHEHFEFEGFVRTLFYHSLVAFPFWWLAFMTVWSLARMTRGYQQRIA